MGTPALLGGNDFVTDGGLETDLIFNRGLDLPHFAAFPLVEDASGRAVLQDYYLGYVEVARRAGAGLLLETPTWRANPDWGHRVGYDLRHLEHANRKAVQLLDELRSEQLIDGPVLVSGTVGPRGDGYVAGERGDPDEAAAYHAPQLAAFASAGADLATAYTLTGPEEAIGVVRAAREVGLPVAVSFTVETDGRLPDGTTLADAVAMVDAADGPDWFLVNCAHPLHLEPGLGHGAWLERIVGLRPNASTLTHAELDASEVLDEGDLDLLAASFDLLRARLPQLQVVGGCCGTDVRHVARLWGQ
ncbi:homocysteine S-methyltransferase [Nocardioides psychrotolerans]|uniref:Homocysteine/selenocysteine methylase (S-methylmethionine-dependent) n=1 Tax=Nocardioides psychrotolerans TaxID=1005945 RepID=A0A1I3FTS9_9ACTN|nr:homocysteine S-methyltransferase family protein [Nocardioides psychrotolerans]GEP37305.1 homocysteine S-methyltransferase [Nocardioides psychrotolerans]SFI14557.1 Homocysteine/selenocysteine methylase (S-methylmethionine-dependent) [Nocardioides psychrotolerans]